MFAQESLPDFDVPGRREPGELPELQADRPHSGIGGSVSRAYGDAPSK
jgi:hypothetical protein